MTQDYLVLDGVYYWHLESPKHGVSARYKLDRLLREGKNVVLLARPTTIDRLFKYHIYERDPNNDGPEDDEK